MVFEPRCVKCGRPKLSHTISGVSDGQGNTWDLAIQSGSASIFYAMNCKAGSNTVSFPTTFGTIWEFSGVAATSALDQTNSGYWYSSAYAISLTPTVDSELVLFTTQSYSGASYPTVGASSPWNPAYPNPENRYDYGVGCSAYQIQTTAATLSNSGWTVGGNGGAELAVSFFAALPANLIMPMGSMGMVC